jgi:serine/threonine protein phosphatase PrpC
MNTEAVDVLVDRMDEFVLSRIRIEDSVEDVLIEAFQEMHRQISDPLSGAAAAVFVLREQQLTVAHVGDCRINLVRAGTLVQLTADHRIDSVSERRRIEESGGRVWGRYVMSGERGIMITRSIGDHMFESSGVSSIPEVATVNIGCDDQWIFALSDGLWPILDPSLLGVVLRKPRSAELALKELLALISNRQLTDDVSGILVELRQ